MKAIILERRGDWAAALRADGVVVRTRQAGEVGDTIELQGEVVRFSRRKKRLRIAVVAAAVAALMLGGTYTYASAAPVAYVSLDVGESSIELSVNRLGRVVSVSALREESETLAKSLSGETRGRTVEDALDRTMSALTDAGYIDGEDDVVIAGITADSERRGEKLSEAVGNSVTASGSDDVRLYTLEVPPADRNAARGQDVSGGRFIYEREGMDAPPGPAPAGGPAPGDDLQPPAQPGGGAGAPAG